MGKSIKKVIFSFSESAITHFGGMYLILRFCKKLKINALLYRHVKYYSRHSKYHPARLSFIVIYTIIAGILRLRTELLVIPARLVRTHNKNELKLPNKYVHKKLFQDVMGKIESLNF